MTRVLGSLDLACGLDPAERVARQADWATIEGALIEHVEREGQVIAAYRDTPDVRSRLERLMAAERRCCPGASWDLRADAGRISTVITAT